MTDADVESDYRSRLAARRAALDALERRHILFSRVRLTLLAIGIVLVVVLRHESLPWVAALIVSASCPLVAPRSVELKVRFVLVNVVLLPAATAAST